MMLIVIMIDDDNDELLCRRIRKTMLIMMYVCVYRYKYACVHYQFLSPYITAYNDL